MTCDDGSPCVDLDLFGNETTGICAAACTQGNHGSCPDTRYEAVPTCGVVGEDSYHCFLQCEARADCPPDQVCVEVTGGPGFCHP